MRRYRRVAGLAITCFGMGILLTFFLPITFLMIIEAIVIIAAGFLFLNC
jgi:hypothetical protein